MTSPFPDELISAYLDGELTAQEQARVEKQLREDAKLRRMCDELRTLRSTLQAMPTADPSEDLAERVLRQAERRMLLGEEKTEKEESTAPPAATAEVHPVTTTTRTRRNWRLVAGAIISIAAMFLGAVLLFKPSDIASTTSEVAIGIDRDMPGSFFDEPVPEQPVPFDEELEGDDYGMGLDAFQIDDETRGQQTRQLRESEATQEAGDTPRGAAAVDERMRPKSRKSTISRAAGDAAFHGAPSAGSAPPSMDRPSSEAPRSSASNSRAAGEEGMPFGARGFGRSGYGALPPGGVDSGAAAGRLDGISPRKPRSGVGGRKTESWGHRLERARPRGSYQIAPPATTGLATQGGTSREDLVQQLVSQLDRNQNLLVQVSIPRDLEARFRQLAVTEQEKVIRLGQAAKELLDAEGLGKVILKAPSPRGGEQLRWNLGRRLDNVILVEGAPADVRKSLERLVSRSDVQVHTAPTAAGRDAGRLSTLGSIASDNIELPANPRLPDATTPRDSATLNEEFQLAKDEAVKGQGIAKKAMPGPGFGYPGSDRGNLGAGGYPGFGGGGGFGGADQPRESGSAESEPGAESPARMGRKNKGGRPNLRPETAAEDAPIEKSKSDAKNTDASPAPVDAKEMLKNLDDSNQQRQAPQAGRRGKPNRNEEADKYSRRGQQPAEGKAKLADETPRHNKPVPPPPMAPSIAGIAAQPRAVIHILFRFTNDPVTAPAREPAKDE